MKIISPTILNNGDSVRIIAPSSHIGSLKKSDLKKIQDSVYKNFQLELQFSDNILGKKNQLKTYHIENRLSDFHGAFLDKDIKMIWCFQGGFHANDLLDQIDRNIIKNNPKIFIGLSDITVLNNAILAKTGLITFQAPGARCLLNFKKENALVIDTMSIVKKMLSHETGTIHESNYYIDMDKDRDDQGIRHNVGHQIIQTGKASGTLIGGNMSTFNLLHGTEYMPKIDGDIILFLEDDDLWGEYSINEFKRNLVSITHQPFFKQVKGLLLGKFQVKSKITRKKIYDLITDMEVFKNIPVVSNLDCSHTYPGGILPIGGTISIDTDQKDMIHYSW